MSTILHHLRPYYDISILTVTNILDEGESTSIDLDQQ